MRLSVERLLRAPGERRAERDRVIAVSGARIAGVEAADPGKGGGLLAMPAPANAHDHARAVKPAALGALELPLELWLAAITGAPRVDPYVIAAVSLGRSALGGQAAVMMHYMRPQGGMSLVDEAREVARAAKDVGVRVGFAVALRDRNWLAYGDDARTLGLIDAADRDAVRRRLVPPSLPPRDQVALVEEIARAIESDLVTVQLGPAGAQWCSDELLEAIAQSSAASGRRVHMHLLETRYQRQWADKAHPEGLVKHLDAIGLLSPRLSVAHAVWARPDELDLLAKRGVTICLNTSSNLGVRSGIAPVRDMLRAGVPIAIGLDGLGIDDDDDALRELRLAWLLHQGVGFEEWLDASTLAKAACDTGRFAVTGIAEPAALEPGRLADVLVLDYAALARDVIAESAAELPLALARATRQHIRSLYVAGRQVVDGGRVTGIDLAALEAEMIAQLRHGMREFNDWQRTVVRMRAALTRFYATGMHCS
ncbi:MAG: hydrolase [Betaproteobacteria bacterium]|nr:MAG: hydrolase [Betaproteobacteria bacterium]